jgi:hypothetical protein
MFTEDNMATLINSSKMNAVVANNCVQVNPTLSFRYMYTHVRPSGEFLWTVWPSSRPDRPWGPPNHLYNGYRVFSGVKRPRRGVDLSSPSIAEVKERVELYMYSHSGPSWPVLGWTLPLWPSSGLTLALRARARLCVCVLSADCHDDH